MMLKKMCTSVIIRNNQNRIFHGRNLDYNYAPLLANLSTIIDYTLNGKIQYTVDAFVGTVLLLTATKPG